MTRNLEHLQLPKWQEPLPRRKHPGRGPVENDKRGHGEELISEAEEISDRLRARRQSSPRGINPKLLFKLQLREHATLDETSLGQIGLRLLARDSRRVIVVFPDEDSLAKLREHLREYAESDQKTYKYNYLASIDSITELTADDRIGFRLRNEPLGADEIVPLDIELWHPGNRDECRAKTGEIRTFLQERGLRVTDEWIGEYICLMRGRVNSSALSELLNIDYVKEIDRRPRPNFEMLGVARLDLSSIEVSDELAEGSTGILIIDSGVTQQHPLLRFVLGDAQVFPDQMREKISGGPEDGDEKDGGHGTAVAGIAVYNDIGECIQAREFKPAVRLFSARVTDDLNEYDEDELVEHQLQDAVEYFLDHYPEVKVINISLGNANLYFRDNAYQFRFAAAIDELAYRLREKNILFIVSSGNYLPDGLSDEQILAAYPHYLLDPEARVIDPATSALALTVGGLSYGIARVLQDRPEEDVDRPVAGERGFPSPFTRSGWGVDGSIKPDLVDFAGDLFFDRGHIPTNQAGNVGIPTTNKNFAPPEGRLLHTVSGTSFAAPRVSNIAARLFSEFPNGSSNLIRALLANSAQIPKARPEPFTGKEVWDDEILRIYGYGQPDFERARWSASNEVLLLEDDTIGIDTFQIYTIPSLPPEFTTTKGTGAISVTLAFDPPTRHTRGDSYLGVTMEFVLFRNLPPGAVADVTRAWSMEERETREDKTLPSLKSIHTQGGPPVRMDLKPGVTKRNKGTLQRGVVNIKGASWQYDHSPLVLAVKCQRKWAPLEITDQRFAIVVSVAHEEPSLDLYARISQQARLYQRVRIQV